MMAEVKQLNSRVVPPELIRVLYVILASNFRDKILG